MEIVAVVLTVVVAVVLAVVVAVAAGLAASAMVDAVAAAFAKKEVVAETTEEVVDAVVTTEEITFFGETVLAITEDSENAYFVKEGAKVLDIKDASFVVGSVEVSMYAFMNFYAKNVANGYTGKEVEVYNFEGVTVFRIAKELDSTGIEWAI